MGARHGAGSSSPIRLVASLQTPPHHFCPAGHSPVPVAGVSSRVDRPLSREQHTFFFFLEKSILILFCHFCSDPVSWGVCTPLSKVPLVESTSLLKTSSLGLLMRWIFKSLPVPFPSPSAPASLPSHSLPSLVLLFPLPSLGLPSGAPAS